MFNQLPPNGVHNGRIPCDNSHSTNATVLCPARLSSTNSSRNAGNSAGNDNGLLRPCNHRSQSCRVAVCGNAAGAGATGSSTAVALEGCVDNSSVAGRVGGGGSGTTGAVGTAGNAATMADSSFCNQPCRIGLVHEVIPCTRVAPVRGCNKVSIFA